MPPFLYKGDNMARKVGKKQMVRSLVDSIYQSAIRDQQAQMQAQQAQFKPVVTDSGLTRSDIDRIYNSAIADMNKPTPQTSAQEIPKLEDNSLPSVGNPTIASELERMQKVKAENKPRSESEQRAIDTYLADLQRASVPGYKPDYQAEIERMNTLANDTATNWSEGEINARNDYLARLQNALAEEQRKNAIVTNPVVKRSSSQKKTTSELVDNNVEEKKEQQHFSNTRSANEQRDMERALQGMYHAQEVEQRKANRNNIVANAELLSGKLPEEQLRAKAEQKAQYDNLSDEGKAKVDKLNYKIASLETSKNKPVNYEGRMRKLDSDIDEVYKNDPGVANGSIEQALNPNKKLTKEEEKQFKQQIKDYEQNDVNENAYTLVFDEAHPDGMMVPVHTVDENGNYDPSKELTPEQRKEQQDIYALKGKMSAGDTALHGMGSMIPGVSALQSVLYETDPGFRRMIDNAKTQNPVAYRGGQAAGFTLGAVESALAGGALEGTKYVSALDKLAQSGGVGKRILAESLKDLPFDVVTDIIPQLVGDINAGKSGGEIASDALWNFAINQGMNTAIPFLQNFGDVRSAFRGLGKNSANVADDVVDTALNPVEMAAKNADVVDDAVAKQAQAVQNVEEIHDDLPAWLKKQPTRAEINAVDPVDRALADPNVYKTHTPEEIKMMKEYVDSTDPNILKMAEDIKRGKSVEPYTIKQVDDRMANDLRNITGLENSKGRNVLIDEGAFNHRDKKHGKNGSRNQTMSDDRSIARIRYILDNYDEAFYPDPKQVSTGKLSLKNGRPAPKVVFVKKIDGQYYVVYAASDAKKGNDIIVTCHIDSVDSLQKNIDDGTLVRMGHANDSSSLPLTSKTGYDTATSVSNSNNGIETTDSLSNLNINQMDESVNPEIPHVDETGNRTMPMNAADDTASLTVDLNRQRAEVPKDEIPNVEKTNGKERISKYRSNSMNKLASVNEQNAPTENYKYKVFSEQEQTEEGIKRWGDNPNAIKELQAKESWDEVDARYAQRRWTELMESDNPDDIKKAERLARKTSYELREGGRLVQVAAEMDDIAGEMNKARQMLNQQVDLVHGTGTSESLDNLATQLDSALSDADLTTQEGRDKVADIVSEKIKNRSLREYAPTNKAMQEAENVKKFKNTNKILDNIRSGKYKDVDELITDIYRQNGGAIISAADQKTIYDLLNQASTLKEGSREQEILLAKAARLATKGAPSTIGKKFRSILYMNMLGNFKTAVSRNALGNFGFQVLEQSRSPIAALIDSAVALKTKQRTTRGWNLEKARAYGRGFAKGAKEQAGDIVRGIDTGRSGSTGWINALKENAQTFNEAGNTKAGNALAKLANKTEFYVRNAMELGDRPFFEASYEQRRTELHQLLDKYGKSGVAGLSDVDDELLDDTIDMMSAVYAADSVFQKRGKMAEGLTKLRNGLGELSEGALGIDVLSTASAPFTLTPGNMLEKAIEYSPLGLLKNAITTGKEISNGAFNQKRFVDELSRTVTGIPVLAGAYGLAKKGMINGGYSDDPDEKAQQIADDYIEYGFVNPLNGKSYDTSDIPTIGPFMQAAGAVAENGLTPEALMQGAEAITMGSTMQGLRKAFGGDVGYSSSGSMLDSLKDTALSSLTQLVPSLARQTAQTTDEYKRDLGEYGTMDYYLNNVKNSAPFLRQTLPIKYDQEGNPVLQNQGRPLGNKILENYVLPMKVSEYNPSDLTQEALRLKEETGGDNRAFMPKAKRSDVKGWAEDAEMDYSEDMFYQYNKEFGELKTEAGEYVINSDYYKSLDPYTQTSVLSDVYSAMKQVEKSRLTGLDTDDKYANIYMDAESPEEGMKNMLEELSYKHNPYGMKSDNYKSLLDSGVDMSPYEGYGEALDQYDVEDTKAYENAYAEGGAEALDKEVQYQTALKDMGLSDSEQNRQAFKSGGADGLQKVVNQKQQAIDSGYVKKDGTANTEAYQKAITVLGDDTSAKKYNTFASNMKSKGYTNQEQYIPVLEADSSLSDSQKGQYAMLMANLTPDKLEGGKKEAYGYDGYQGYYRYKLLQNVDDYNGDGKHNKYDRIQQLYEWGFDKSTDEFNFYTGLKY